jgi:hypothetical protein
MFCSQSQVCPFLELWREFLRARLWGHRGRNASRQPLDRQAVQGALRSKWITSVLGRGKKKTGPALGLLFFHGNKALEIS